MVLKFLSVIEIYFCIILWSLYKIMDNDMEILPGNDIERGADNRIERWNTENVQGEQNRTILQVVQNEDGRTYMYGQSVTTKITRTRTLE